MSIYDIPLILADKNASFWFPPKASTFAAETDALYMYILYISIFFFVLVVGAMIWFAIAFRRRPGYKGDSRPMHNNTLEIAWTVIPTLIVIWIFARGVHGYMDMMQPPAETIDINVTARQWDWQFQYPNGAKHDQLHVPINRAVRLRMRSEDVLHAFYVPAFRAKMDIVPGRVVNMWFQPILEGEFDLFCAEYCGDNHSEMIKRRGVVVHDQAGYEEWLAEAAKPPTHPVAHGFWLYRLQGCKSCHSVEKGKRIVGPSFAGSFGESFTSLSGQELTFDMNYVRESLLEPQKQMRPEYQSASQMPSFQGKLKEDEIAALSAFLEALKDDALVDAVKDGELTKDEAMALGYADPEPADDSQADAPTDENAVENGDSLNDGDSEDPSDNSPPSDSDAPADN